MRGPRESTMRPHIGPELLVPTEKRQVVCWNARDSAPFPARATMFNCV